MALTPGEVIADLEKYIDIYGIKLSKEAKKTFQEIEEFSFKCNYPSRYPLFFSKPIRNSKEIQRLFCSKHKNALLAAVQLEIAYYNALNSDTNYQRGTVLYSYIHSRKNNINTDILDTALKYCVKDERNTLENSDIIAAAMDSFERYRSNCSESYQDEDLDKDYFTLCHVVGCYDENLQVKFEYIKDYLSNQNTSGRKLMLTKNIFN